MRLSFIRQVIKPPIINLTLCGRSLLNFDPRPPRLWAHNMHYDISTILIHLQVVSLLSPGATASGLAPPSYYYASPDTTESQQAESNFTASPSSPTFELLLSEAPSTENPIPGVP